MDFFIHCIMYFEKRIGKEKPNPTFDFKDKVFEKSTDNHPLLSTCRYPQDIL